MIPPTPGADPASRLFGYATPPDGAGPIGPDQLWPTPIDATPEELRHCLNPLQYVPVVGMIYRLVTGETIPAPVRVLAAGITGGPVGMLLAGFMGIAEAILSMKPDNSRPSVPEGMSATGGEAGVQPVTPGSLTGTAYTSLATTVPEWMQNSTAFAQAFDGPRDSSEPTRGAATYQQAALEYRRSQALEKGLV